MGKSGKINLRLLLLLGIALLILVVIVLLTISHQDSRLEIQKNYITSLSNDCDNILGVYADMADMIYHLYIDTTYVKKSFARGVKSQDSSGKDRCRKVLHDELSPLYEQLIKYDFRQMHFHERDNTSYLRMHRPDRFGDDLTGIRPSVEYVNKKKEYASGFEEGKIFNGYRFVYPLFVDDEHIGSAEISVSMNTIIRQLKERFNKEAKFIILKKQVEKKVFESERSNYIEWFIDDNYMCDRLINDNCILLKERLTGQNILKIKNELARNREKGSPFIVELDIDSVPSVLTFLPIKNFLGENVAYIFSISDSARFSELDNKFYHVFFALIALFALLVIFSIYYQLSHNKIERMATFDSLTDVYARGSIMQFIENEYQQYRRYQKVFSLIMIDIDHFKNINDRYGHGTGDLVLSSIASIMKNNIRKSDSVGRYGGEEFIVLLPETQKENAAVAAEKLRQKISGHAFETVGTVTVSCGVAEAFKNAHSIEEIINEADKKLYVAKEEGRNRVVV